MTSNPVIIHMSLNSQLSGPAAELMHDSTWGLSTRTSSPSPPTPSSDPHQTVPVWWQERFVLSLPAALSEQLVQPAPGDNPFAGQPLSLTFELASPTGGGGLGDRVARAVLPVQFDWMAAQVGKECASAARICLAG
jgi:vacuolar protein sorting-associated protein 13A/C